MKSLIEKNSSYIVLGLILFYGVFKIRVLIIFAPIVGKLLDLLDLDTKGITSNLTSVTGMANNYAMGWFLYYPSYFLLHVIFIALLYRRNIKVRNFLILALSVLIGLLIGGIFIFRLLELHSLSSAFLSLFRSLFGLPFILLAIEGGRILYNDIIKLSESKK